MTPTGRRMSPLPAPRPARRRRRTAIFLASGGGLALAIIAGAAWLLAGPQSSSPATTTTATLIEQMELAAEGVPIRTTVHGGPLRVERRPGQVMVIAEGIPPEDCVKAGWKLVRKGILSINGITPPRVSAARLADLCNMANGPATLAWMPHPPQ